jgi:hypothetical protein
MGMMIAGSAGLRKMALRRLNFEIAGATELYKNI